LFIDEDVWTVDEDGKLAKASPEKESRKQINGRT
jgi:hypothetical protein